MSSPSVMINKAELTIFIDRLETWARRIHEDLERIGRRLEELDETIQENNEK